MNRKMTIKDLLIKDSIEAVINSDIETLKEQIPIHLRLQASVFSNAVENTLFALTIMKVSHTLATNTSKLFESLTNAGVNCEAKKNADASKQVRFHFGFEVFNEQVYLTEFKIYNLFTPTAEVELLQLLGETIFKEDFDLNFFIRKLINQDLIVNLSEEYKIKLSSKLEFKSEKPSSNLTVDLITVNKDGYIEISQPNSETKCTTILATDLNNL